MPRNKSEKELQALQKVRQGPLVEVHSRALTHEAVREAYERIKKHFAMTMGDQLAGRQSLLMANRDAQRIGEHDVWPVTMAAMTGWVGQYAYKKGVEHGKKSK